MLFRDLIFFGTNESIEDFSIVHGVPWSAVLEFELIGKFIVSPKVYLYEFWYMSTKGLCLYVPSATSQIQHAFSSTITFLLTITFFEIGLKSL